GNVPNVNSRIFDIPADVSIRSGYTPGAASAFGSTRKASERPGVCMVPGAGAGNTSVNEAGRVELTRAPSPRLRPTSVRVNGRPMVAPRGFNSVSTGGAAPAVSRAA